MEQVDKIKEIFAKYPQTIQEIVLEQIEPNPWNPNSQPEIVFNSLVKSIQKYGWLQFPVVRYYCGVYQVIDGEHRTRAAKKLGLSPIRCLVLGDKDNEVEEVDAKLLTQLLNTRGTDDILKKAKLLKSIQDSNQTDLFGMLPETAKQIEEELKLLSFDFSQFENMGADVDKGQFEKALSISIAFERELRKVYADLSDTNMRLLIEAFYDWNKKFQEMTAE